MNLKRVITNKSKEGLLFSNHYVGDQLEKDDEVYLFEEILKTLDITILYNQYNSQRGGHFYDPTKPSKRKTS